MEVTLLMPSVGGSTFMRWRSCMATRYASVRLFAASGGSLQSRRSGAPRPIVGLLFSDAGKVATTGGEHGAASK
jgi:hypothetical protein